MGYAEIDDVLRRSRHKGGALLLLIVIAKFVNKDGYAWPSVDLLAHLTKMSHRQVWTILKALRRSGELLVESGGGRHRSNHYRLCLAEKPDVNITEIISVNGGVQNSEISSNETLKSSAQNPDTDSSQVSKNGKNDQEPGFESMIVPIDEKARKKKRAACSHLKCGLHPHYCEYAQEKDRGAATLGQFKAVQESVAEINKANVFRRAQS